MINQHNSYFIGLSVGEEYRNLNIGSLLISSWIDLCLNNNYNFLGINHKQRKPFLLYLLKTYGFDILDQSLYETRPDIITICRSHDLTDKRKFLLFKSLKHEQVFKGTNIYKTDNYFIVHNTKNLKTLDKIILPLQNAKKDYIDYILLKEEQALNKVNETINKHKR